MKQELSQRQSELQEAKTEKEKLQVFRQNCLTVMIIIDNNIILYHYNLITNTFVTIEALHDHSWKPKVKIWESKHEVGYHICMVFHISRANLKKKKRGPAAIPENVGP